MISGPQALHSIDTALRTIQQEIDTVTQQVGETHQALNTLERQKIEAYKALSAFRLKLLDEEDVERTLNNAETVVQGLLDRRFAAGTALERDLAAGQQQLQAAETAYTAQQQRIDAVHARLDDIVHATQERLSVDRDYMALVEAARMAEEVAVNAERKASLTEQDRVEKGQPYEDDRLFMYLWRRHYGTAQYRAFPLFRYLDGKVARLCDYEPARVNYAMLLEIPKRLNDYVAQAQQHAEAEAEKLSAAEEAALAEAEIAAPRAELTEEQTALAQSEQRIAEIQDNLQNLREERARLARGDDPDYQKAVETLTGAYQDMRPRELLRAVYRTPEPEDDAIIEQIDDIERRHTELAAARERQASMLKSQEQRLQEMLSLRREFQARRYDDSRSTFSGGDAIGILLGEVLRGALSSRDLLDDLAGQVTFNRRRANPDFGSGGLRRSRRRRRSGNAAPWGTGGGFSGGGSWKTGGSIGGSSKSSGGFRTGGGF